MSIEEMEEDELYSIPRIDRATKALATDLSRSEATELVTMYYQLQKFRIAAGNQAAAAVREERPHQINDYFASQYKALEAQARGVLDVWSNGSPLGRWAREQKGIGPVLAAGLLAHIDLSKCKGAGSIWRFAGLDPTSKWGKGEKRPWNAELKVICWKIGDSFVKVSGRDDAFYGKLYRERKAYELSRQGTPEIAEQAKQILASKNFKAAGPLKAYGAGILPDGHVDARAKRWTVKLFLSHYFDVGYELEHGSPPPWQPYAIDVLGHKGYIPAPH